MTSMMMRYTSTIRIPLLFSFQKRALCKQRSRCGCINWKPGDLASTFTIKQCTARIRTCRVLGEVLPSSVRSSCSRRRNRYSANTRVHTNSLNKHQQHQAKQGREKWNAHRSADCSVILAHRAARSSLIHRALSLPPDICHGVSVCGSGRRVRSTRGAYAAHTPHVQTTHFSLFGNSSPTK